MKVTDGSFAPMLSAVEDALTLEGTVAQLLHAGQVDAAIQHIAATIHRVCRSVSEEMFLDPHDRHRKDPLGRRILMHPLFAFAEKETMLQVLHEPQARAEFAVLLDRADALVTRTAEALALALFPDTPTQ